MENPTEEFNEALLELGKVTYKQISERAGKLVADKQNASESWLAHLPIQILQACQACHRGGYKVAVERFEELKVDRGDDFAAKVVEEESKTPDHVFILAGLTPPVDPVTTLFECEVFVAAWVDHREDQTRTRHGPGTALLADIHRIREVYKVPQTSGVTSD